MNIDEYCRRLLLGTTLEEKLLSEDVSLNSFKKTDSLPKIPGRPAELSFDLKGTVKLPSMHQLEDTRNRGFLLHFFLNHELLALEIMAMVILKFPELPDSFKRSLLKTMRDEQKHASLYIKSMKEFGVEPGQMPVNRFFWDCFKDIDDPMKFITGMSLTFEQANLDFSKHYAKLFRQVGDDASASVLEKIYQDEIGHVGHGVKCWG